MKPRLFSHPRFQKGLWAGEVVLVTFSVLEVPDHKSAMFLYTSKASFQKVLSIFLVNLGQDMFLVSPFGVFQENDLRAPVRFWICEFETKMTVHLLTKKQYHTRIHRFWAVFVVNDIIVYFLSLFTFRYHFLPLYYHFCTCCTCYLRYIPLS